VLAGWNSIIDVRREGDGGADVVVEGARGRCVRAVGACDWTASTWMGCRFGMSTRHSTGHTRSPKFFGKGYLLTRSPATGLVEKLGPVTALRVKQPADYRTGIDPSSED